MRGLIEKKRLESSSFLYYSFIPVEVLLFSFRGSNIQKKIILLEDLWLFSCACAPPPRRGIITKALLRVQFLLTFLGEGGGRARSRKGEREGSKESQQKFDFFSDEGTPNF